MRLLKPCLGPLPCELWLFCCFARLSSQADHPAAGCMYAISEFHLVTADGFRVSVSHVSPPVLMAMSHECRLYKHVGPDGIPYALIVAEDLFTLQELLEKIVGHLGLRQ